MLKKKKIRLQSGNSSQQQQVRLGKGRRSRDGKLGFLQIAGPDEGDVLAKPLGVTVGNLQGQGGPKTLGRYYRGHTAWLNIPKALQIIKVFVSTLAVRWLTGIC